MKDALLHFNRGRVDPLALARVDQKRVAISADTMTNWIPRVLGPMSLRPGWEYITSVLDNEQAVYLPFIFSTTDTALVELTDSWMRVLVNNVPITRPSVSAAINNGYFNTDISGWTDNSDTGGSIQWQTGGYLRLDGDGIEDFGIADQQVGVTETGTEHALRIVVERGPVTFKVGSTQGDDDYVAETSLAKGVHSLSFTPTGTFHIRFMSSLERAIYVDSIDIEPAGVIQLATPWSTAKLSQIRWDQSGDVLFLACEGIKQMRIERRDERSWSIVEYLPEDGPFRTQNLTGVTVTAAALSGNTSLTATKPIWKSTNVGSLFRLESDGQTVLRRDSVAGQSTDSIRVFGVTSSRIFTIEIEDGDSGSWSGTIRLQRSLTDPAGTAAWSDVPGQLWNTNITTTYDDGLDNQIVWYRLTADSAMTGFANMRLYYTQGSLTGVGRITGFVSSTQVQVEVLNTFGNAEPTPYWSEGEWSTRRGWPSCVALHEGRLWWAGKDHIIGSVSDAYDSFDIDFEGDAGPINRTIGSGPVDNINWALSLQRLILGGDGAEHSVRSSSFDEPITPSDFMLRAASTQGSAKVPAIKIDQDGLFIQKSGTKIFRTSFDGSMDYTAADLTLLVPEMGEPSIVRMAVQRQPDTRIHCVRSDGTVMLGVIDRVEEVLAWVDIETDGLIEDVVILPGTIEDNVYYVVNRTISGGTNRFLEKWATEASCRGGLLNWQADALRTYDSIATTTITNLTHLEGEQVVVWADGEDVGTNEDRSLIYTVSGGQITLATAASKVIVGLPYTATFKSAKLGSQQSVLAALNVHKRIDRLGLTLAWVHPKGLRFGPDTSNLDDMPEVEEGTTIDADTVRETYAEHEVIFPGTWESDARIVLEARAPRPVTVMAAVPDMSGGR